MYSKEENKAISKEFWIAFAIYSRRKWILYDTKIKDFSFKFQFEGKDALVVIDIEQKDQILRRKYFDKMLMLKNILEETLGEEAEYRQDLTLQNGKVIERIEVRREKLKIQNKNDWGKIFEFFRGTMIKYEQFFEEYGDIIASIHD